ncbi:MAG: thioredoxin fold domain-containing protein [Porphyromonadaceae bacterium]|jgi:thiol:disulfide interchange protein DsbD|nr:thioredoxin fold domain-containing protein [Porphyromonadaceae bacterium]
MRLKIVLFVALFTFTLQGFGQIFDPVTWSIEQKSTGKNTADIIIKAKLDKGWHLYGLNIPPDGPIPTKITFEKLENAQKEGSLQALSKLIESYDPNFDMNLNWYSGEAVFVQKISFTDPAAVYANVTVNYMVCDDSRCLPPSEELLTIGKPGVKPAITSSETTSGTEPVIAVLPISTTTDSLTADSVIAQQIFTPIASEVLWTPVIEELKSFGADKNGAGRSLMWIFILGFLGGLIALLTPCVWPIIPMTVSFFLKRTKDKSRGRRDAVFYGLAIIVIYVSLGLLITAIFGASALNSLATNAVFNLLFFALLVVFAISFFGVFEIQLPASWANKMDAKADATSGIVSILFMAFTLVLVSFSCTGPIIGTLLVEVSVSGSYLGPAIGMLGFAVALALPFSFFAFFPALLQSMPKSGGWLNKVKVVLAFLELALALKFFSVADLAYGWRLLDRETFLALWIVIFALLGFYLIGKIKFAHDSDTKTTSVPGLFLGIISLAFAVYMVPGLWGAPLKSVSAFAPPLFTQDFNLYENEVHPKFMDYEKGMQYAAQNNMPVIIDFTGYGCVNCRKMEASVWTDPRVTDRLNNEFVLISLYVDDKKALAEPYEVEENGKTRRIRTIGDKWSYLQRYKFGANAQPFYVMLDPEGKPLTRFLEFQENPAEFLKWLDKK